MNEIKATPTNQLRRNSLGLIAVTFMVISAAAPLTGVAGAMPLAFLLGNGTGIPLTFLLLTLVMLAFAAGYVAMSRHVTNAGAFYAYAARGLGGHLGGAVAITAMVSYNAMQFGLIGLLGGISIGDAPLIRVRGVVNRFGAQIVHDGVDLDVQRGEILGVVGGSGSGKSVLMRSIIGLRQPNDGRIQVLGVDARARDPATRRHIERNTGVLFQDGALFSSLTVGENVQVPLKEYYPELPESLRYELALLKIKLAGLPETNALTGGLSYAGSTAAPPCSTRRVAYS